MQRLFWIFLFRLLGWDTRAQFPSGIRKCVIIAGPHTHWMDFPVGVAYRSIMRIGSAHYLAKKELFDSPFGFLFRWLGGIPVDRSSKHNLVDQVAGILSNHSDMMIAISPEGTRKKVERLRTGFYYIAKKAGVPIVMVGFDFLNRRVLVSDALYTTDDPKADFDRILAFFTPIQGKIASRGFAGIHNQFE